MNKYPTIEMQIKHLQNDKNIIIDNEDEVKVFLLNVPYEKSIKEIKPMILNYSNGNKHYPRKKWSNIEEIYNSCLKQSKIILGDVIEVENRIKSTLIYALQADEKYKNYIKKIPNFLSENLGFYSRKYGKEKDEVSEYILNEKFYLVINAMGFKELINLIFKEIYKSDKLLYQDFLNQFLNNDLVLQNASNFNINKIEVNSLFENELTFNECLSQSNHIYYKDVLDLKQSHMDSISLEIVTQIKCFLQNIEIEKKFKQSAPFLSLKEKFVNAYNLDITDTKFANFFYEGELTANTIIKKYKETKEFEVENINEVAVYVSKALALYAMSRSFIEERELKALLAQEYISGYLFDLKKVSIEKKQNENLKKYLKILADVRNSVAHGGTFIIPLFKDHDGDLRLFFAKQYLEEKDLIKLKQGRHYYRYNKVKTKVN